MMPPVSGFAELAAATHYSFLDGASSPAEMVGAALAIGHAGIGIADTNTVAGVVRAQVALRDLAEAAQEAGTDLPPFKLAVGARLVFADGTPDV
ncbi:MAG: PHP domain-containing protein, partial [Sandarakinorhabdus sp.]